MYLFLSWQDNCSTVFGKLDCWSNCASLKLLIRVQWRKMIGIHSECRALPYLLVRPTFSHYHHYQRDLLLSIPFYPIALYGESTAWMVPKIDHPAVASQTSAAKLVQDGTHPEVITNEQRLGITLWTALVWKPLSLNKVYLQYIHHTAVLVFTSINWIIVLNSRSSNFKNSILDLYELPVRLEKSYQSLWYILNQKWMYFRHIAYICMRIMRPCVSLRQGCLRFCPLL